MVELKCPNCAANITLDEARDFGFCSYCGTQVQLSQKVIVEHTGNVNVAGIKTEKEQLNIAWNLVDVHEYHKAITIAKRALEDNPTLRDGWLIIWISKVLNRGNLVREWYSSNILNIAYAKKEITYCDGDSWVTYKDIIGLSHYDGMESMNEKIKREILHDITSSEEFRMTKKFFGKDAAEPEHTLGIFGEDIDMSFEKSTEYMEKVNSNYEILAGYIAKPFMIYRDFLDKNSGCGSFFCFFYCGKSVYQWYCETIYEVTAIKGDRIELRMVVSDTDTIYGDYRILADHLINKEIRIFYIDEEVLVTSEGYMTKGKTNWSDRYICQVRRRKEQKLCQVCGKKLSILGKCPDKCEKYFQWHDIFTQQ